MQSNLAAEGSFDGSPEHGDNVSDGTLREHGKKGRLHLPGSKSARKVAGRAANKATKGASRMASALSKKVHHAMDGGGRAGSNDVPPELFGAAGDEEEPLADLYESVLEEEGEAVTTVDSTHPYDGAGTKCAAPRPEVHSTQPEREQRRSEVMAASWRKNPLSQAAKNVRPLQCRSIWEIPTSRFPEPERPAPAPKACTSASEQRVVATPAPQNIRDTTQQAASTLHDLAAGDVQTCERVGRILLAVLAALLISGLAAGLAYLVQ